MAHPQRKQQKERMLQSSILRFARLTLNILTAVFLLLQLNVYVKTNATAVANTQNKKSTAIFFNPASINNPPISPKEIILKKALVDWKEGNAGGVVHHESESSPPLNIAYAISVTSCQLNSTLLDGAAILGYSIHLASNRATNSSRYDYTLYAFVHKDASVCADSLSSLGYKVLIKDQLPFQVQDIQHGGLRAMIETKGCCGSKEFLKLYAYSLEDHPVAVHLDTDVVVLQPLDDLFDAMLALQPADSTSSTYPPLQRHVMGNASIPPTADFFFTRDYLQNSQHFQDPKHYGVQGGFFALRPNRTFLEELSQRILNETYSTHSGWSRTGHTGYWGASQIQGYLSYIYGEYYPERAVELNRCYYNSMGEDDPHHKKTSNCTTGQAVCQDCRETPFSEIKTIHLTTCRKPWECPRLTEPHPSICKDVHLAWFKVRRDLETSWGRQPPKGGWNVNWTLGYCFINRTIGHKRLYHPLQQPFASFDGR
jgi:hypothetical protein